MTDDMQAAKAANAASTPAKAASAVAARKPAATGSRGRGDASRYTTNELNSAARKAGLIIEFTPTGRMGHPCGPLRNCAG